MFDINGRENDLSLCRTVANERLFAVCLKCICCACMSIFLHTCVRGCVFVCVFFFQRENANVELTFDVLFRLKIQLSLDVSNGIMYIWYGERKGNMFLNSANTWVRFRKYIFRTIDRNARKALTQAWFYKSHLYIHTYMTMWTSTSHINHFNRGISDKMYDTETFIL